MKPRWRFLANIVAAGVLLDFGSKLWAQTSLEPGRTVHLWGGLLKLTLSFNPGAAFGVHLGEASRPLFSAFSVLVLVWLLNLYRREPTMGRQRALGVALVCAGALGNLIDRLFWQRGVVDFLGPYDLGFMVWPIFNVADCYVVVGIACLLFSLRNGEPLLVPPPSSSPEDSG